MDGKRELLIIALLGLIGASERVRQEISALREEPIDQDVSAIHEALIQLHALFAPDDERQDGDVPETLAALQGALAGFICNLAEITLQPALDELTLLESFLDGSDAMEVLPLLHKLVDGLKGHATAN